MLTLPLRPRRPNRASCSQPLRQPCEDSLSSCRHLRRCGVYRAKHNQKKEYGPKHDSTAIMIGLNLVDTTRDGWYGVPMSDISPKKNTVRLFLLMK